MQHLRWFLWVVPMFLIACSKENDYSESDKTVVEAYLISGSSFSLRITQMIPFNTDSTHNVQMLDSLPVHIVYQSEKYALHSQGNGYYTLDASILLPQSDEMYGLEIERNGVVLKSETTIPPKPENFSATSSSFVVPNFNSGIPPSSFPDPVDLAWTGEDGAYFLVVVKNIETDPEPVNEEMEDDNRPVFRSEPIQGSSWRLGFQNFSYLGTHQIILFRLQPEYAALYEQNGDNSLNLANVPTNIEGGLGIFTGIAASDTLYLEVKH